MNAIEIYDTTLRDGTQGTGFSLTSDDKVAVAKRLDAFGVDVIEGGWPGSNPKDAAFFELMKGIHLAHARLAAFGMTRRKGGVAETDANLNALLDADAPVVTLVGKSWTLHVTEALGATLDENLAMIRDSVAYLHGQGREVFYDAEHFFDGYRADPEYALETLQAAADAGATRLILCDTNGGSLPGYVAEVTARVCAAFSVTVGIHTHNDAELAVANAHPNGATPWTRPDYVRKFEVMTDGLITPEERTRFLQACADLPGLPAGELHRLHVAMPDGAVQVGRPGIF